MVSILKTSSEKLLKILKEVSKKVLQTSPTALESSARIGLEKGSESFDGDVLHIFTVGLFADRFILFCPMLSIVAFWQYFKLMEVRK
jgi:hypothetical protein